MRTSTSTPFALTLRTLARADLGRAPKGPGAPVGEPAAAAAP